MIPRLSLAAALIASVAAAAAPAAPDAATVEVFRSDTVSSGTREFVTAWLRTPPDGCWSRRVRSTSGGRTTDITSFVTDPGAGPVRVSQYLVDGRFTETLDTDPCDGQPPFIDAAIVMTTARRGALHPVGTTRWRGRRVTVAKGPARLFTSGWTAAPRPPLIIADGPAVVLRSPGGPVRVHVPRIVVGDGALRTVAPARVITVTRSTITGPAAADFSFALPSPTP